MENISRIISILLFLLMLCGLFYGVDKGIDITDEAFINKGEFHFDISGFERTLNLYVKIAAPTKS